MSASSSLPFFQSARIVFALGWADFKLKYRGTVRGFLWSVAFPVTKFIVILYVAGRFNPAIPQYHLYLFLGLFLWEYFSMTSTALIGAAREKMQLFQKVKFPRILVLFSVSWMHLIIGFCYMAIFLLFALWRGIPPHWTMLYLLPVLLQLAVISFGIGAFLGAYVLRYHDIGRIWSIALQLLFWLTPIFYALPQKFTQNGVSVHSMIGWFMHYQPLSVILSDARASAIYTDPQAMPTFLHAVTITILCGVLAVAGGYVFHRRSRYFLDER